MDTDNADRNAAALHLHTLWTASASITVRQLAHTLKITTTRAREALATFADTTNATQIWTLFAGNTVSLASLHKFNSTLGATGHIYAIAPKTIKTCDPILHSLHSFPQKEGQGELEATRRAVRELANTSIILEIKSRNHPTIQKNSIPQKQTQTPKTAQKPATGPFFKTLPRKSLAEPAKKIKDDVPSKRKLQTHEKQVDVFNKQSKEAEHDSKTNDAPRVIQKAPVSLESKLQSDKIELMFENDDPSPPPQLTSKNDIETSQIPKRVRKKRKVVKTKSVMDGKYMRTEDVVTWESYSEDEAPQIPSGPGKSRVVGVDKKTKGAHKSISSFFTKM